MCQTLPIANSPLFVFSFKWDCDKPRNNCLRNCPSTAAETYKPVYAEATVSRQVNIPLFTWHFPVGSRQNFSQSYHNPALEWNGKASVTHEQTGLVGESGIQSQWVHQTATWIRSAPKIEQPPRWRNCVIAIFKIHNPYHVPGNAFLYYM